MMPIFPPHAAELLAVSSGKLSCQRSLDQVLEEICYDYEMIAKMLAEDKLSLEDKAIVECLQGLREEMTIRLAQVSRTT